MNFSAKTCYKWLNFLPSTFVAGTWHLGPFSPNYTGVQCHCMKSMSSLSERKDSIFYDEKRMVLPALSMYIYRGIEAIRNEKIIAVPTDTLYGLACDARCAETVNKIYELKGRKHTSPLAICVGDVSDIPHYADVRHLPTGLLESLFPGPVTVILKRVEPSVLDKSLNPGLDSIGVRIPKLDFVRRIAHDFGSALALTSANVSGEPSSVSINDFKNLWEECQWVYDHGVLSGNRAGSTVIDLSQPMWYKILRPGSSLEATVAALDKFGIRRTS